MTLPKRRQLVQTELGLMPEDWSIAHLPMLCERITVGIATSATHAYRNAGVPMFRNQDIKPNKLQTADILYIDPVYELRFRAKRLRADDLLLARTGYPGTAALVPREFAGAQSFTTLIATPNRQLVRPNYLCAFLNSERGQQYFADNQIGGGQKNIGVGILRRCPIPIPRSLKEQDAIANTLADADALIESLEALIAKKRAIKQGAMQHLLRPTQGWREYRLGDVAQLKARIGWQGLTTAEYLDSGDYHLITGTDFSDGFIDWDNCHFVDQPRYDQDRYIQVREGDVLVTKDGTIGKVAFIDGLPKPATLNSGVFVIRPLADAFRPKFFYYLLMSNVFRDFLTRLSAGSTINHLYQKDFVEFSFSVPPSGRQQDDTASILLGMDREIRLLGVKLAKARLLKQGMMQELLTGRVRLV